MTARRAIIAILCIFGGLLCGPLAAQPAAQAAAGQTDVLNPKALPLGDGRVSSEPRSGHVFSCNTAFRGGGAEHAGDWIQGSTWDATRKITVQGEVFWPNARFSLQTTASERVVSGNALPTGHATGRFPIARSDPAFQIDRNPNAIAEQAVSFRLPLDPVPAATPSCVPMGMIGVALSGVPIFNALDAGGRDAVAHEVQDRCHGHPQMTGMYHYHGPSDCVPGSTGNNTLVGYALDGFGIYSTHDANGRELTNADLDACHGRSSPVMWNGKLTTIYHYVMTREYPYTIGCFRGTPVRAAMQGGAGSNRQERGPGQGPMQVSGQGQGQGVEQGQRQGPPESPGQRPGGGRRPPPEATAACNGKADSSSCGFVSPRGDTINGQCRRVGDGEMACVPERR